MWKIALWLGFALCAFGCVNAGDDTGNDTGEEEPCGGFGGLGEATCEELRDNYILCIADGDTDVYGTYIIDWFGSVDGECEPSTSISQPVFDNCACDDCVEIGDDTCEEWSSCWEICRNYD